MSRYTPLTPLALEVFDIIKPYSSSKPIRLAEVLRKHSADESEMGKALQSLTVARLITSMRHTINGTAYTVYWPTGLKPVTAPTLEEIHVSAEPKNSLLKRLILLHGPISGPELAEKARETGANIPAKNVSGLLEVAVRNKEIIVRKVRGVNTYMTALQADEAAADESSEELGEDSPGAHMMSAPDLSSTTEDEPMPAADPTLLALANKMLAQKCADLEAENAKHVQALANQTERIVDLEDQLQDANKIARARGERLQSGGMLGLLLIDSEELTDYVRLNTADFTAAKEEAMNLTDRGDAAQVEVIRFLGKAARQVEWKDAA